MLILNLIPKTSFFRNLRSELPQSKWDEIRRACYKNGVYRCEICGGEGPKHPVECHELWEYTGNIQKLTKLIAVCPQCHEAIHFGLAELNGNRDRARNQLRNVNKWSDREIDDHLSRSVMQWHNRNSVVWKLDISPIYSDWDNLFLGKNKQYELQLAAVKEFPYLISTIDNPSEELQIAAAVNDYEGISWIDYPSEKVQVAAVVANPAAYDYIYNPCLMAKLAYNHE